MRTIHHGGKTCLFRFENLIDMPDYIERTASDGKKIGYEASITNSKDFTGGVSFKGALDLVNRGWEDGATKVAEVKTKMAEHVTNGYAQVTRVGLERSAGGIPNVAEALTGNPYCYRRFVPRPIKTKVLDLWWMVNANCQRRASKFVDQGVALLAAIDQVEATGVRVGVNVFSCIFDSYGGDYRVGWSCQVKRFEERLQIPSVIFPLAHAAYFRRLGFALLERQGTQTRVRKYGMAYGYPIENDMKHFDKVKPLMIPKGALILKPDYDDSVDVTYNKLLKQLEKEAA